MYILSQISVGVGMIIDLVGKVMKYKNLLLTFMAISSAFYSLSYFFLGSYLPAIMQILLLIRAVWYMFLDERKAKLTHYFLPFCLINVIFAVSVIFFWEDATTILLVVAMFILTFCLIFKNMVFIRISLIANSLLWCAYNFTIQGYVNMACDLCSIVLYLIALFAYNIQPGTRKKRYIENNYDIKRELRICKSN